MEIIITLANLILTTYLIIAIIKTNIRTKKLEKKLIEMQFFIGKRTEEILSEIKQNK